MRYANSFQKSTPCYGHSRGKANQENDPIEPPVGADSTALTARPWRSLETKTISRSWAIAKALDPTLECPTGQPKGQVKHTCPRKKHGSFQKPEMLHFEAPACPHTPLYCSFKTGSIFDDRSSVGPFRAFRDRVGHTGMSPSSCLTSHCLCHPVKWGSQQCCSKH